MNIVLSSLVPSSSICIARKDSHLIITRYTCGIYSSLAYSAHTSTINSISNNIIGTALDYGFLNNNLYAHNSFSIGISLDSLVSLPLEYVPSFQIQNHITEPRSSATFEVM
jgi:hypothetical protein